MTEQVDRKDLKIQALLEKISNLTTNYENQLADFRVNITLLSNENEELKARLNENQEPDRSEK